MTKDQIKQRKRENVAERMALLNRWVGTDAQIRKLDVLTAEYEALSVAVEVRG